MREHVDEGGLLSYGANVANISRRAADQRDRHRVGAHAVACDAAGGVGLILVAVIVDRDTIFEVQRLRKSCAKPRRQPARRERHSRPATIPCRL